MFTKSELKGLFNELFMKYDLFIENIDDFIDYAYFLTGGNLF